MVVELYVDAESYTFKSNRRQFTIQKDLLLEFLGKAEDDLEKLGGQGLLRIKLQPDKKFLDLQRWMARKKNAENIAKVSKYLTIKIPEKIAKKIDLKPGDKVSIKIVLDGFTPALTITKLTEVKKR